MVKNLANIMFKTLNNKVNLFLSSNANEEVIEAWEDSSNLDSFNKSIKNVLNKENEKNKPKRPNSAYIEYCISERKRVSEENPDADNREIMRIMGREWKSISHDDSKIYRFKEMHLIDKERYIQEMAESKKENTDSSKPQKVTKPRARSNYLHFCASRRASLKEENPEFNPKQVMSALGSEWSALKLAGGTKEYDDLAAEEKASISSEKDLTEDEDRPVKKTTRKPVSKKAVKEEAEVEAEEAEEVEEVEKPKKRGAKKTSTKVVDNADSEEVKTKQKNGYVKFINVTRETVKSDNPTFDSKRVTSELGSMWKSFSEDEKQKWKMS